MVPLRRGSRSGLGFGVPLFIGKEETQTAEGCEAVRSYAVSPWVPRDREIRTCVAFAAQQGEETMIAVLDARTAVAGTHPGPSPEETAARLKSLDDEIAACGAASHDANCRSAVLHFRLGAVLLAERSNVAHRGWLAWLDRCGVEHRRAQRAMQIARYFQEEWRLAGLTCRQALRRSGKAEEESAGDRRRNPFAIEGDEDGGPQDRQVACASAARWRAAGPLHRRIGGRLAALAALLRGRSRRQTKQAGGETMKRTAKTLLTAAILLLAGADGPKDAKTTSPEAPKDASKPLLTREQTVRAVYGQSFKVRALVPGPGVRIDIYDSQKGKEKEAMALLPLFPDTVELVVRIPVTDADLVHLQGLKNLKSLDFTGCECPQFKGDGLKYLAGLKKMRSLGIMNTAVGDDALDTWSP